MIQKTISILILLACSVSVVFADPDEDIIKLDEIRFPQVDYKVEAHITSIHPKKDKKTIIYDLSVKGRNMAMLNVVEPRNERGRVILMKGYDTWVYLPTISKPVRLTLRERLIGEVALGDIARANFSADYKANLSRVDVIDDKNYNVYELNARTDKVMYSRVLLWAEQDTLRPYQAQFFGTSGKLMKIASYNNYMMMGEALRPTRLIMTDPIHEGQYTIVDYKNLTKEDFPEQYFTSAYISRMSK